MIGDTGSYDIPEERVVEEDDPIISAGSMDKVNKMYYSPLQLNSRQELNYRSYLVKQGQQLAAAKNLAQVWGRYVIGPDQREVAISHLAPKLCNLCHKDEP